jgi:hypothetical protein
LSLDTGRSVGNGRPDTVGVQGHRGVQEGEGGRHWEPPVRRRPAIVWSARAVVGALPRRCWELLARRRVSLPGRVAAGEGQPGVAPPPLGVAPPLRRLVVHRLEFGAQGCDSSVLTGGQNTAGLCETPVCLNKGMHDDQGVVQRSTSTEKQAKPSCLLYTAAAQVASGHVLVLYCAFAGSSSTR